MTDTAARSEILARIEAALTDRPAATDVPRAYEMALPGSPDRGALVELFAERVGDYRATVHRTDRDGLAATIGAVFVAEGVRRVVVPKGVPPAWLRASPVERLADEPPLSTHELDGIDGVVTGCAVAIAETGTIVLDAGADQGRRALSLLPDHHVCLVFAEQIVGSVPEAIAALDPSRPQTWVSGPSATSDIELERIEGVHGPRHLAVVIVEERPG
jgi:L-lactate dehydrogenase complex protein LldG